MTTPSARKGAKAEREVRAIIADLLGVDAPRIRAGATDDIGDLALPETTVEVKSLANVGDGVTTCLRDLIVEHERTINPFAVGFVRIRGGRYVCVMTPEMWATYHREATA